MERMRRATTKTTSDNVIVVVKAEKLISKTALTWALTHVVRPGDSLTLLAVYPNRKDGRRIWRFPKLSDTKKKKFPERIIQISESCSQMLLHFHDKIEVKVRIKVVTTSPEGAVAAEARSKSASWVILDKKLKTEQKHCVKELHCNIVVMKGSQAKVLKLNLGCSDEYETQFFSASSSPGFDDEKFHSEQMKHSTPVSSPEEQSTSYSRNSGEVSFASSDAITSLFVVFEENPLFEVNRSNFKGIAEKTRNVDRNLILTCPETPLSFVTSRPKRLFWIPQNHFFSKKVSTKKISEKPQNIKPPISRTLRDKFDQFDQETEVLGVDQAYKKRYSVNCSIRDAVPISRASALPPPLCSFCKHKAPLFGKPPRRFTFEELKDATNGFSRPNFLVEGSFGLVHKGVLRDGQVVAVKQLKFAGPQGDADFCREVRLLSCAQHRNVVLLIGFCIEGKKRILVYEYICNGSLEIHLHGAKGRFMDWNCRLKIAIGAARGLRYLHEDCRVGCIVHKDMRPDNILLTHDFEPLVADFGLASWNSDRETSSQEQINDTIGYLAPEYFNGGIITEKVDIYAFGMVLLELITGHTAKELYKNGDDILANWLLEPTPSLSDNHQKIHPSLASDQFPKLPQQLQSMIHAAFLCLRQEPESRPHMSKVLGILEAGDGLFPLCLDLNSIGNQSGHIGGRSSHTLVEIRGKHRRKLSQ